MKSSRWLKQALVLSVVVNVLLLLLLYTTTFRRDLYRFRPASKTIVRRTNIDPVPEDILDRLIRASLRELCGWVREERLVYGFPLKLWALGIGISHHDLDFSPALTHPLTFTELKSPQGTWRLPNLSEEECLTVYRYLCSHKYPLTSRGMFRLVTRDFEEGIVDQDALYHFCHLPEFLYLRTLLIGADLQVSSVAALVQMVLRGGEHMFFSLCPKELPQAQVMEQERRRVLMAYLDSGESLAALLLLVHDLNWIIHSFSDQALRTLVCLLPRESPYTQEFVSYLAQTPRQALLQGLTNH